MAELNPQSFHCTEEDSSYQIDLQALSHVCATDAIEGTVFSKAWVLSLLVKMIHVIQPMGEVEERSEDLEGEGRVRKVYEEGGDQRKRKHSSMEEDICVSKTLKDERFHDGMKASGSQETLHEQSMEHMRSNNTDSTGDNNVIMQGDPEQDDIEKFDEGTENDLCQLWDATANTVREIVTIVDVQRINVFVYLYIFFFSFISNKRRYHYFFMNIMQLD